MDETQKPAAEDIAQTKSLDHIKALLENQIGIDILHKTDYKTLQSKLLELVSHTLLKDPNSLFFEDKLIVENSLNLMLGCLLYKNDLFNDFLAFKGLSQIKVVDDFILHGLLFCQEEKIREYFKHFLLLLSRNLNEALSLNLRLLSSKFPLISDYPSKQFFELFCELIDYYFLKKGLGDIKETNVFDPELLLSEIIDKIRADKARSK